MVETSPAAAPRGGHEREPSLQRQRSGRRASLGCSVVQFTDDTELNDDSWACLPRGAFFIERSPDSW